MEKWVQRYEIRYAHDITQKADGTFVTYEAYKQLQTKIEQHRWIPVSERLPEERGYISVCNIKTISAGGFFWNNTNCEAEHLKLLYTHWKPIILPEAEEQTK